MAVAAPATEKSEGTLNDVARILGRTRYQALMVLTIYPGKVRVSTVPGRTPRYSLADARKLAAELPAQEAAHIA